MKHFLTVLDSNFLEVILTLLLQHNHAAHDQTEVENKLNKFVTSPSLQRGGLLFFLPHHLWKKRARVRVPIIK